jgi:hypothetical protein
MDYGDILDFSIKLYTRNFWPLLLAFLLPYLPVQLLQIAAQSWWATAPGQLFGPQMATSVGSSLLAVIGSIIAYPFALAATTQGISEAYLGRRPTLRSCYAGVVKRFWPLLGAVMLALLLTVGGFLLLVIPGIYLYIIYLFVAQAVVLENLVGWDALKRSSQLVSGYFWKCLLVILIVSIIVQVISWIALAPLTVVFGLAAARGESPTLASQIPLIIVGAIVGLLLGPFQIIARTLLYYDLRIRKEGFDLQVMAESIGLAEQTLAKCPQCGAFNPPDSTFCGTCGTRLVAAPPSG